MAVKLSEAKVREHRMAFSALRGPEVFKKAVAFVEQLSALSPLLSEAHRRELAELFDQALPRTNSVVRSRSAARPRKEASAAPSSPSTNKGMVACPTCRAQVRADRLEKHVQKVHGTKKTSASQGPKQQRATAKQKAKAMMVCGDCQRTMTREDYSVHICRMRARGPIYVQGGSPGLRRR